MADYVEIGGQVGRLIGTMFYPSTLEDGVLCESGQGYEVGDATRARFRRVAPGDVRSFASEFDSPYNSLLDDGD